MLLKGQWEEREMQRMLNTEPMGPDTPHPSLSAPSNLFFVCHSTTELQTLRAALTQWNYVKRFAEKVLVNTKEVEPFL